MECQKHMIVTTLKNTGDCREVKRVGTIIIKKIGAAQASSCSRATRCSLNLLREAEVFDWR